MNEAMRERTFEEEANLYETEAREILEQEEACEGESQAPELNVIRTGMRTIRKARELMREKRGKWLDGYHAFNYDGMTITGVYPTCNLCGHVSAGGFLTHTRYCPNCGARMEDKL